ncbi:MAG: EamA/RhaT family transporter [Clostridiales bacterium]|nr:EamA/RhaT family transporter [Clostridiales bacterium]
MQTRARLSIIASMAIFGTIGLFVRAISVTSAELALYRAVIAAVMLTGYFLISRTSLRLGEIRKELPLLLLSGAAMGFNWILLFEAYKYTTVSVATLSYYFAPVIVTVACPLLFKEKMGPMQWLCFAMSTLGLVLITGLGDLSAGSSHLIGIAFGLGAAVLYASVMLLNKRIKGVTGLQRTYLQFLAAIAVLLPYVLVTSGFTLHTLDGLGWVMLLIVGAVHTCLAYCLYFPSLKALPGQETAILSYIDPLLACLLSVTLLGESMSPVQLIGGALILGFTLLNELHPRRK